MFDWPPGDREGATLKIGSQSKPVPPEGPVRFRCRPGKHRVAIARPGFQPFVETVTLKEGQTRVLHLVWDKATEEGPPHTKGPLTASDKPPADSGMAQDKPADAPSDGTATVAGHPLVEPEAEPPAVAVDPGASDSQQPPFARERLPVPPNEAQQRVATQLEEVYKLSRLKAPEQKSQLAAELFDLGKKSKESPTEQFVLLRTASELARDGGDAALMFEAVEAIGADYDVDLLSTKQELLVKFAQGATNSQRIGALVEIVLPLVDQAIAEGRYDLALQFVDAAYQACTRSAGKEYRKQVYKRRNEVQKLYEGWQRVQQALATLETEPLDPDANLVAGRWYCFNRGDWGRGLGHLANGADDELAKAARADAACAEDSRGQLSLGDEWWDLAQKRTGNEKDALMLRAGTWYRKAHGRLPSSLEEARVKLRLAQIAKIGARPLSPGSREPSLPSDCVLFMTFEKNTVEEIDGKIVVKDLSGAGNHGTGQDVAHSPDGKGVACTPNGVIGGALACNGGELRLRQGLLNQQSEYTLVFWAYKVNPNEQCWFFWERVEAAIYGCCLAPGHYLVVQAWNQNTPANWMRAESPRGSAPAAQWLFVAITAKDAEPGTGKLRIRINDRSFNLVLQNVDHSDRSYVALGGGHCLLDQVAAFHRALSDQELWNLYEMGFKGRRPQVRRTR